MHIVMPSAELSQVRGQLRMNYSAGGKSCSAYPVSASPWVCGSDTRDLSTSVPGSRETNPGVRPALSPSTRHRLAEAHSAGPFHKKGDRQLNVSRV